MRNRSLRLFRAASTSALALALALPPASASAAPRQPDAPASRQTDQPASRERDQAPLRSSDQLALAFHEQAADTRLTREAPLSELGFENSIVLGGMDSRRDIYLPVPAGLPIYDASIAFDSSYLRGDGGRTTVLLSVDGAPVFSRRLEGENGNLSTVAPVDGQPRPSGFVKFGVAWSSVIAHDICEDERGIGNVLKILPGTRFVYSYDAASVTDLTTAWSGLPAAPVMMVAGGKLSKEAYDTAWRLGLAIDRSGKRLKVLPLPDVGDDVNLDGLNVPADLQDVAPFFALAKGGRHRIKDQAEIGALLLLKGSPLRADVAVADPALLESVGAALDALGARTSGAAAPALREWRASAASLGAHAVAADEIKLVSIAGQPMIAVGPAAGAKAAGAFDGFWRRSLLSPSVLVRAAAQPAANASNVPLSSLGGASGNLDVLARGDWTAIFDLNTIADGGRLPSRAELDVSAAPGASPTLPVATVYINDTLLAARKLEANGLPERIAAKIPPYALASRNVLRVSFQRQPQSYLCRETPQAFPVAVLPTSYLQLGAAASSDDFLGALSGMAQSGRLVVPDSYLSDPRTSLPRLIRIADAGGVSAAASHFDVLGPTVAFKPKGGFVAVDVPLQAASVKTTLDGDRLVIAEGDKQLLDVTGLTGVGVAQVVHGDGYKGILWQSIGSAPVVLDKPFRLNHGTVALIGPEGVLKEIDAGKAAAPGVASDDEPVSPLRRLWRESGEWGQPIGIGLAALFFLFLARATIVRRKRRENVH